MARPKYRLTEKAYLDEILHDPESPRLLDKDTGEYKPLIVEYDGIPAHYMVAENDEAKAMMRKYPPRPNNAIDKLTIVGPGGVNIQDVLAEQAAQEAAAMQPAVAPKKAVSGNKRK